MRKVAADHLLAVTPECSAATGLLMCTSSKGAARRSVNGSTSATHEDMKAAPHAGTYQQVLILFCSTGPGKLKRSGKRRCVVDVWRGRNRGRPTDSCLPVATERAETEPPRDGRPPGPATMRDQARPGPPGKPDFIRSPVESECPRSRIIRACSDADWSVDLRGPEVQTPEFGRLSQSLQPAQSDVGRSSQLD